MKRTQVIITAAVLGTLVVVYAYDRLARARVSCEALFERTTATLARKLDRLTTRGRALVGEDTIRDLTERTHSLAANLKTCCLVLEGGRVDAEKFLRCKAGAEDYEYRLETVASAVNAANGSPPGATGSSRGDVEAALRSAEASSEELALALREVVIPAAIVARPSANGEREHEPNDDFSTANLLPPDAELSGTLSGAVDRDFFRVRSPATTRDRARVRVRNRSATLALQALVFDARKSRLAEHYDVSAGADLDFTFTVEPGQDHYVQVFRFGREGGSYDLSIALQHAADAYEPNDDPFSATAIRPGEPLRADILDERDADWYRLAGPTAARLRVRLENRSAALRPRLRLYDGNRAEVADHHALTAGTSLELALPQAAAGDCYLEVTRAAGRGGPYEIAVTDVGGP